MRFGGPARLRRSLTAALLPIGLCGLAASARAPARTTVLPCRGVQLTASYLADAAPGAGPGFLFRIENQTHRTIRLAEPVPSSAHWYARVGDRWWWRASAGRGGALVNALLPHGPMFAWRPAAPPRDPQYRTIPAGGAQQWIETMRDHPDLAYRPSCAHCNYPGESEYQAVFAYAYLPNPGEAVPDLLRCGLRSDPVPMPPKALRPDGGRTQ